MLTPTPAPTTPAPTPAPTQAPITISEPITSSSTISGTTKTQDGSYTYFTLNSNTNFTTPITIDSNCYFKITATTGTVDNPIIINGQNNTVTIKNSSGSEKFKGLFQNGSNGVNGKENITIKNFKIDGKTNSATLANNGGWLCQSYFSNGVTNTIENC